MGVDQFSSCPAVRPAFGMQGQCRSCLLHGRGRQWTGVLFTRFRHPERLPVMLSPFARRNLSNPPRWYKAALARARDHHQV